MQSHLTGSFSGEYHLHYALFRCVGPRAGVDHAHTRARGPDSAMLHRA